MFPMHPTTGRRAVAALLAGLGALALLPAPASAAPTSVPMTGRVSVSTNGLEVGADGVDSTVLVDATGRYVFFSTKSDLLDDALGLPDHDTNGTWDVYRRDRLTEVTERVSFADESTQLTGPARLCGISPDGSAVGFYAQSANLPGGPAVQVYVRDLTDRHTWLGSVSSAGTSASGVNGDQPCPITADGDAIAFVSSAALVSGDSNGANDVFVRDRSASTTVRASVNQAGGQITGGSLWPAMSADGAAVAFETADGAVTPGDLNGATDIFVRKGGTTVRATTTGAGASTAGLASRASLSSTGRYVAFQSGADDVLAPDDNATTDVYRKDLQTGAVERASVTTAGQQVAEASGSPIITGDGRYVSFTSASKGFYPADAAGFVDAFRHDFDLDRTDLLSRVADSIQPGNGTSGPASLSADGRVAAFASLASNLAAGDLNGARDAFVRDATLDTTPFASPQAFIEQQHEDFLGQPAGAVGPNAGKILTNGLHSPDHYVVLSAHSSEWAGKRGPLTRLYWAFFLRVPDQSGMQYWTNKLTSGTKLSTIASQFAASSEFQTKYGSLANQVFVTKIYENIFDREPDAGGLAYWTKKLDTKQKTRGDVMVSFSESSEGKRVLAPQTDIVLLHLGMMRTMPTTSFVKLFLSGQKGPWTPEVFAASLRGAPQYASRVA